MTCEIVKSKSTVHEKTDKNLPAFQRNFVSRNIYVGNESLSVGLTKRAIYEDMSK